MGKLVLSGTPWEVHKVKGTNVYVKREDLCCPEPGPSFSKIRGVKAVLTRLLKECDRYTTDIGVLDTFHSKAGWGVSYICDALGLQAHVFYPVYKAEGSIEEHDLRVNQQRCRDLGAILHPLQAGRSAILYHQAKKLLIRYNHLAYMMPNGLQLQETVDATAGEAEAYTPDDLFSGTWVCSISSGTICAGLIQALRCEDASIIAHMGYHRSMASARNYMLGKAKVDPQVMEGRLVLIDEGFQYKQGINEPCPFPCNEYYDLKAWRWLKDNINFLSRPIVFWNIGA